MKTQKIKKESVSLRRRVFNRAIQIINKYGWTQQWFQYHGRYCAVGALRRAESELGAPAKSYKGFVTFNDRPGRRRQEVIAFLKRHMPKSKKG